jgi:hypothetical protein
MRSSRRHVSSVPNSDSHAASSSLRPLQRRRSPLSLRRFFFGQQRRTAVKDRSRADLKSEQRQTNPTNRKKRSSRRSDCYKGDRSLDHLSAHSRTPVTKNRQRHFAAVRSGTGHSIFRTDVRRGAGQKVQLVQLKSQSRQVNIFARQLCQGSPGEEMSGEAWLATPARLLYEPSHRPQKNKERPKSLSFCSDNTVTDHQQAAPVRSGPVFLDLGLIAAVTACPMPSGHKVRKIAAEIRNESKAEKLGLSTNDSLYPESGRGLQHS